MKIEHAPTYNEMMNVLEEDPSRAIQLARVAHGNVNYLKYQIAAIAYGYAAKIRSDEALRKEFYDNLKPDHKREPQLNKLLLHVFVYVYAATTFRAYKRASEHSHALQETFDKNSLHYTAIARFLKESGGFDGLIDEAAGDEVGEKSKAALLSIAADREAGPPNADQKRKRSLALDSDTVHTEIDDDDEEADDGDDDIGELEANDSEMNDDVPFRPTRKAPKPGQKGPVMALVPRDYIAKCILAQPKNDQDREAILQAIKEGKTITANLVPALKVSSNLELYAGGGSFRAVVIENFAIEVTKH